MRDRIRTKWTQMKDGFYEWACKRVTDYIIFKLKRMAEQEARTAERLRYWQPVVRKGLFATTVDWQLRPRPLTDAELHAILDTTELKNPSA